MREGGSLWALLAVLATFLLGGARGDAALSAEVAEYDESPEEGSDCGLLYVSISPLVGGPNSGGRRPGRVLATRLAEITWDFSACDLFPQRAAIYELGPRDRSPFPFLDMVPAWSAALTSTVKGHIVSNFSVPRTLPGHWDMDSDDALKREGAYCFHFRVVLFSYLNRVLASQCLKIEPSWMHRLDSTNHNNLALTELMLPGTHNSGSFSREGDVDSHLVRYLLTQDLSMWEQLVMGVRYFDMRVGFYPQDMGDQQNEDHPDHGQRFWVNHDMVRVQPLRPMLEELKKFFKFAPGEAVVLDFHRFPVGFSASDDSGSLPDPHEELIALIKEILGDIMIPNNKAHLRATLKDLYNRKKHVVVAYSEKSWQTKESQWLWPAIPQQWGNQQSTEGLITYLDKQVKTMHMKHYQFWAMMAELTPTMFDILLNLQRSSLRFMADQVNRNITEHSRSGYWFSHANIIAVDYIESTDLVNVAIASNRMRSERKKLRPHLPVDSGNRTIVSRRTNIVDCDNGPCVVVQTEYWEYDW